MKKLAKEEVAQFVEQFADRPAAESAQIASAGVAKVNEVFVRMHMRRCRNVYKSTLAATRQSSLRPGLVRRSNGSSLVERF